MTNKNLITFTLGTSTFQPAEEHNKRDREYWIDTSFQGNDRAIGQLRFPWVDNGRYKRRHPIYDKNENFMGHLSNGAHSIGYTWNCVYAGNCFWLTNQTFSSTLNNGGANVTLVDYVGQFLFSETKKYKAFKSFGFDGLWAGGTIAFKLLDEGKELFYLTRYGFALFDTYRRSIISKTKFPFYLSDSYNNFALSPKTKLFAIAQSSRDQKDIITGEYRYKNWICIYDLALGSLMGEKVLETTDSQAWSICFSKDGRKLKVSSYLSELQFELNS